MTCNFANFDKFDKLSPHQTFPLYGSKQRDNISVCSMEVGVLGVWNDIDTESESEVSNEECEDDLVMQKCIGSSSEEENITRQSFVAGPSGPSRNTCSKRNPVVVYE